MHAIFMKIGGKSWDGMTSITGKNGALACKRTVMILDSGLRGFDQQL
jgi:hypothetical protein